MHNLPNRAGRPSLRQVLMGTAAAAALAGVLVAVPGISTGSSPAIAQSAAVQVPAQPFSFADVVERVRPAVVSVRVEKTGKPGNDRGMPDMFGIPEDHPMRKFFREFGNPRGDDNARPRGPRHGQGLGSGFVISADGYIVTNHHVVDGGNKVTIAFEGGEEIEATVVGADPKTDLALLKVETDEDLRFVKFSSSDVRVGDWVVAVGNPFGLGGTVTAGIVSARGRDIGAGPYDDFLQIDAPVNKGNSGGPAFNHTGEVIGVNTAIFSPSGGNVGIAFAIPSATVVAVIDELKSNGKVSRGWLGVQIQPVTDEIAESLGLADASGAIIADLTAESPGGKAGLQSGDVIMAVNGKSIEDAKDLARRIGDMDPDETAKVEIWRDGARQTMSVTLGSQPANPRVASLEGPRDDAPVTGKLGLKLAPASARGGDDGAVIVDVEPGSDGERKGLRRGDVIVEAGGSEVRTPADVAAAVREADDAGRKAVLLRVRTEAGQRFVALKIEKA